MSSGTESIYRPTGHPAGAAQAPSSPRPPLLQAGLNLEGGRLFALCRTASGAVWDGLVPLTQ